MHVNPTPGGPIKRLGRRTRLVLVLISLSAAVAVGASAGGLVGTGRTDTPASGATVTRAGIGAAIGLLLAIAMVMLLRALAPSRPALHRVLYGGRDPSTGTAFRRSLPLVLLLAGLGALIGASTAPARSTSTSLPKRPTTTTATRANPRAGDARYVDRNGRRELQVDRDGDGRYESVYVLCPGEQWPASSTTSPSATNAVPGTTPVPDGMMRMPIDHGCDGTIDDHVDIRIQDIPTDVMPAVPASVAPRSSTVAPPTSGPAFGSGLSTLVLIVLGVAVIAAIVVGVVRRKPKPATSPEPGDDRDGEGAATLAAVASSVARSSDELAADDDPRRAILAAYGELLHGLSAAGMPRRPEEAPEEYLRRCLAPLSVDRAPFEELTSLFAVARFSRHDITEGHRRAAAAALEQAGRALPSARSESTR